MQGIGKHLLSEKGVDPAGYQLTLQHLRDFLTYLEEKQIINCNTLSKDPKEMRNLINDLVKLDFNKFNCPLGTVGEHHQVKEPPDEGVVYLYSPINVKGNNNIVNTNISIYPPAPPKHSSHIKVQPAVMNPRVVFSQPVSHGNSQEKEHHPQREAEGGHIRVFH